MTLKTQLLNEKYYLFGSRLLTHGLFWLGYYCFFSLLWAKEGNYYQSFGLELILMPTRILASYTVLYILIPRYLLREKEGAFLLSYLGVVILGGFVQRVFVYYYHELIFSASETSLFDVTLIVRSTTLINTTVLLLSALKVFQLWKGERSKKPEEHILIRAEKRNYRVALHDIYYIEALGNYVTYYLADNKRLISYSSLKDVEAQLPSYFERIHKSFIINKNHVASYSNENVEIGNRMLPLGKAVELTF